MNGAAYLDTSAFVKRFLNEPGTLAMDGFAASTELRPAVSSLTVTEFRTVLNRMARKKEVTEAFVRNATTQMLKEIASGALRFHAVDAATFNLAGDLVERLRLPVATLDAIHLACAHATGAALMVSADKQLLRAASESGLDILDVSFDPEGANA